MLKTPPKDFTRSVPGVCDVHLDTTYVCVRERQRASEDNTLT